MSQDQLNDLQPPDPEADTTDTLRRNGSLPDLLEDLLNKLRGAQHNPTSIESWDNVKAQILSAVRSVIEEELADMHTRSGSQPKDTKPLTFVVYRTAAKALKSEFEQDNYLDGDEVQFEGVEFWDGTVAIRWRTPTTSMSFWESMEALKRVHIYAHPDYGTKIVWSNREVEEL